jgi:hypothetical protein
MDMILRDIAQEAWNVDFPTLFKLEIEQIVQDMTSNPRFQADGWEEKKYFHIQRHQAWYPILDSSTLSIFS